MSLTSYRAAPPRGRLEDGRPRTDGFPVGLFGVKRKHDSLERRRFVSSPGVFCLHPFFAGLATTYSPMS